MVLISCFCRFLSGLQLPGPTPPSSNSCHISSYSESKVQNPLNSRGVLFGLSIFSSLIPTPNVPTVVLWFSWAICCALKISLISQRCAFTYCFHKTILGCAGHIQCLLHILFCYVLQPFKNITILNLRTVRYEIPALIRCGLQTSLLTSCVEHPFLAFST